MWNLGFNNWLNLLSQAFPVAAQWSGGILDHSSSQKCFSSAIILAYPVWIALLRSGQFQKAYFLLLKLLFYFYVLGILSCCVIHPLLSCFETREFIFPAIHPEAKQLQTIIPPPPYFTFGMRFWRWYAVAFSFPHIVLFVLFQVTQIWLHLSIGYLPALLWNIQILFSNV